jgi:two-component system, OmpR family, response regulator
MRRILLVEDDDNVRSVVEHVLLALGYIVDSAECAFIARALLCAKSYDLILADGRLGDGDGFEIADIGAVQGAKTLIVTGYAMAFEKAALERHQWLAKPIKATELIQAVERLIGPSEIENTI